MITFLQEERLTMLQSFDLIGDVGLNLSLFCLQKLGSPEAAAADRSLNRRNLDLAMQEWARLHSDAVGGRPNEEALAKVRNILRRLCRLGNLFKARRRSKISFCFQYKNPKKTQSTDF